MTSSCCTSLTERVFCCVTSVVPILFHLHRSLCLLGLSCWFYISLCLSLSSGAAGHHGDSLVEKILTVLQPLPGHTTDVQVDMLELTNLQRIPDSQPTLAPGCLAQTQWVHLCWSSYSKTYYTTVEKSNITWFIYYMIVHFYGCWKYFFENLSGI